MKKSLLALAVLGAFAGAASAQSVTLFGVFDATLTHTSANSGNINFMREGGGTGGSRLGFRGEDDIGGGLKAGFWLEGGFQADNGAAYNSTYNGTATNTPAFNTGAAQGSTSYVPSGMSLLARQGFTFNRRSTISLMGNFGEVRLGRDLVPSIYTMGAADAFTGVVGASTNITLGFLNPLANGAFAPGNSSPQARAANSIGYFLPKDLGGFYGQVMYALSEQPSGCSQAYNNNAGTSSYCYGAAGDGAHFGLRGGFATGPLDVQLGYGLTHYGDMASVTPALTTTGTAAGTTAASYIAGTAQQSAFRGTYKVLALAGSYDLGVVKLMGGFNRNSLSATSANGDRRLDTYTIGARVPVGASGQARASFNTGKRTDDVAGAGQQNGTKINQFAVGYVHNLSKRTQVYTSASFQKLKVASTASASVASSVSNSFGSNPVAAGSSGIVKGLDIGLATSF